MFLVSLKDKHRTGIQVSSPVFGCNRCALLCSGVVLHAAKVDVSAKGAMVIAGLNFAHGI
jgi:hypothetical protein